MTDKKKWLALLNGGFVELDSLNVFIPIKQPSERGCYRIHAWERGVTEANAMVLKDGPFETSEEASLAIAAMLLKNGGE